MRMYGWIDSEKSSLVLAYKYQRGNWKYAGFLYEALEDQEYICLSILWKAHA